MLVIYSIYGMLLPQTESSGAAMAVGRKDVLFLSLVLCLSIFTSDQAAPGKHCAVPLNSASRQSPPSIGIAEHLC